MKLIADTEIRDAVNHAGRTEDMKLSSGKDRLLSLSFNDHAVNVMDVGFSRNGDGHELHVHGFTRLTSKKFKFPHGVCFIDDDTLAVANREGILTIVKMPPPTSGFQARPAEIIRTLGGGWRRQISTPGSVVSAALGNGKHELLVANNYVHTVTSHTLDASRTFACSQNKVLLKNYLDVPDGVSLSQDGNWLAVSNHGTGQVLIYDRRNELNETTLPTAYLSDAGFPHGLEFAQGGRYLIVADAGAPVVTIYDSGVGDWSGQMEPAASLQVMSEGDFLLGRNHIDEGGPKGLCISEDLDLVMITCEYSALSGFVLSEVLAACKKPGTAKTGKKMREKFRAMEAQQHASINGPGSSGAK